MLTTYAVLFVVFLYAPVLLLPLFSFDKGIFATFPLDGFTLEHYRTMANDAQLMRALRNSLIIGVSVSVLSTSLAIPAALALTRHRIPGAGGILGFMMLPLVVPSIVLAVSLLVIMLRFLNVPLSLWTIATGHIVICMPFCLSVLMSRLEGFDPSLEEASRDLGCTGWQTFWRLTWPLAFPGIVSSLLLGFIISFDEFVIAFFLTGSENTLPVYLYSQVRFPDRLPSTLALGSLILMVSAGLVILSEVIRRSGTPSSSKGP